MSHLLKIEYKPVLKAFFGKKLEDCGAGLNELRALCNISRTEEDLFFAREYKTVDPHED